MLFTLPEKPPLVYGLCQCGCGRPTAIAKQGRTDRGDRKGEPVKFCVGHGRFAGPIEPRFWSKVALNDSEDDCWPWLGKRGDDPNEYGRFFIDGRCEGSHRVAWLLVNGDIPPETPYVLHRCDNPPCVRPTHLFLGTHLDNMHDMFAKGRRPHPIGTKNGNARLTPTQVLEIRASADATSVLAKRYGLSWTATQWIREGVLWKCVGGAA